MEFKFQLSQPFGVLANGAHSAACPPLTIPPIVQWYYLFVLKNLKGLEWAGSKVIMFQNSNTREPHLTVPNHHKTRAWEWLWEITLFIPKSEQLLSLFKEAPACSSQIKRITICRTEIGYV